MSFRAWFFSDVHLKSESDLNAQVLIRFLRALDKSTTHVFFMGDVFDLWVGSHPAFIEKFPELISVVRDLVKRGIEVHIFEGNHDFHLELFWQKEVGCRVYPEPSNLKVGPYQLRLEHGDQTNQFDTAYLRLRRFFRNPTTKSILLGAPGWMVRYVGESWSGTSRKLRPYENPKVRSITRNFVHELAASVPFDIFICGHTHMKDDVTFQVGERTARFINLGTWLAEPSVFELSDTYTGFRKLDENGNPI